MGFLAIVNCLAKLEKGSQEICFIGILFLRQFPYLDLQFLGTRLLDTPDYPHPEHFKDAWQTGLQLCKHQIAWRLGCRRRCSAECCDKWRRITCAWSRRRDYVGNKHVQSSWIGTWIGRTSWVCSRSWMLGIISAASRSVSFSPNDRGLLESRD